MTKLIFLPVFLFWLASAKAQMQLIDLNVQLTPLSNQYSPSGDNGRLKSFKTLAIGYTFGGDANRQVRHRIELRGIPFHATHKIDKLVYDTTIQRFLSESAIVQRKMELGLRYEVLLRLLGKRNFSFVLGPMIGYAYLQDFTTPLSTNNYPLNRRNHQAVLGLIGGSSYQAGPILIFAHSMINAFSFGLDQQEVSNPSLTPRQRKNSIFDLRAGPHHVALRVGIGYLLSTHKKMETE